MATTSSRYSGDSRATQDKLQQAAQLAGIADVFSRTAAQSEAQLELLQSLLGGIVRSQQHEARRLARRDGEGSDKEGSPRVQQARERSEQLQAFVCDAIDKVQLMTRLTDVLGTPGVFAGYVYGENGSPTPDHEVRLLIADKAHGREETSSAKTDASGYFRIAWASTERGAVPETANAGVLAAELLMALAGEEAAGQGGLNARAATASAVGTSGSAAGHIVDLRVQVVDPHGALVFEDPTPPAFENLSSEFRCYVVPVTARG